MEHSVFRFPQPLILHCPCQACRTPNDAPAAAARSECTTKNLCAVDWGILPLLPTIQRATSTSGTQSADTRACCMHSHRHVASRQTTRHAATAAKKAMALVRPQKQQASTRPTPPLCPRTPKTTPERPVPQARVGLILLFFLASVLPESTSVSTDTVALACVPCDSNTTEDLTPAVLEPSSMPQHFCRQLSSRSMLEAGVDHSCFCETPLFIRCATKERQVLQGDTNRPWHLNAVSNESSGHDAQR